MTDDLSSRGPRDRANINIHEDHEVEWWTRKLGVSPDQIREAVAEVGTSAEKVAQQLNRRLPK
jgi:hypothetical protein